MQSLLHDLPVLTLTVERPLPLLSLQIRRSPANGMNIMQRGLLVLPNPLRVPLMSETFAMILCLRLLRLNVPTLLLSKRDAG